MTKQDAVADGANEEGPNPFLSRLNPVSAGEMIIRPNDFQATNVQRSCEGESG